MHDILSGFIYWLSSNILSFSNGIKISQKSLFLHTFSCDLSLFSAVKVWRQLRQQKSPLCFEVIPCNNANNLLLQDNAILLFLRPESLIESFIFHGLSHVVTYKLKVFLFLLYTKYWEQFFDYFSRAFSNDLLLMVNLFFPSYIYL